MSINVAIIIPAYREALYIEKTLRALEKSYQFAQMSCPKPHVIVVVNNPQNISQAFVKENQLLVRYLEGSQPLYSFPLTILDYTDPGIAFGVGQARRIGMDYAVAKFLHDPNDRLVCLDADTLVNEHYIADLFDKETDSYGFVIDFEHELQDEAMVWYELFLRYVPYGLAKASSPFDFIAIGSAIGCTVEGYRKIGGMPSKSATEDFHFLNKLRKLGKIEKLRHAKVFPSTRKESKTSLGTGAFLFAAGISLEKAVQKLVIPTPDDFQKLKQVLYHIRDFYNVDSMLDLFAETDDLESYGFLKEQGVVDKLYLIKQNCKSLEVYFRRILEVMDGLETIRLLRTFKNKRPPLSLLDFQAYAQQLLGSEASSPIELVMKYRNI
ncbi:MAG: hypothetical protein KDD46_01480 [Bdellovibrionales bacterium]|nr:hypothetical protein [Bdellovibrionales bacterium]